MERRLKDSDPDSVHPAFGSQLPGTGDRVLAQVKSVLSVNNMPTLNTPLIGTWTFPWLIERKL